MTKRHIFGLLVAAMLPASFSNANESLSALEVGDNPADGQMMDGEITKGLFIHEGIPVSSEIDCSPELLQEVLDSYLQSHMRSACRFDLSAIGANFFDSELSYNDDYAWSCPCDDDLVAGDSTTRESVN